MKNLYLLFVLFVIFDTHLLQAQACTVNGEVSVCPNNVFKYDVGISSGEKVIWKLQNMKGRILSVNYDSVSILWTKVGTESLLAEIRDVNGNLLRTCTLTIVIKDFEYFTLEYFPKPPEKTENQACKGDLLQFITRHLSNYSYQWTYNDSIIVDSTSHSINIIMGSEQMVDVCVVITNDANGCMEKLCKRIYLFDLPQFSFRIDSSSSRNFCTHSEIIFKADPPAISGPKFLNNYEWSVISNNQVIESSSQTYYSPFNYTFLTSGNYTVRLTVTNQYGCSHSEYMELTIEDGNSSLNQFTNVVCKGQSVTYTTNNLCTSYHWGVEGGTIQHVSNDSCTILWDRDPTFGYGIIRITKSGCPSGVCDEEEFYKVYIMGGENPIIGEVYFCSGKFQQPYSINPIPNASYIWRLSSKNGSGNISLSDSTKPTCFANFLSFTGTFTLSCEVKSSIPACSTYQSTTNISVYNFSIGGNTVVCYGDDADFDIVPAMPGINKYILLKLNGIIQYEYTTSDSFITIPHQYLTQADDHYKIEVIIDMGQSMTCTITKEFKVMDPVLPPFSIMGPDIICPETEYRYSTDNVGSNKISWEIENGIIIDTANAGVIVTWFDTTADKVLKVRREFNGCLSEYSRLEVLLKNISTIDILGPDTVCVESFNDYSCSESSADSYEWSIIPNGAGRITSYHHDSMTVEWNNQNGVQMATIRLVIHYCNDKSLTKDKIVYLTQGDTMKINHVNNCFGDSTLIYMTQHYSDTYEWDFGDGSALVTTFSDSIWHQFNLANNYNVTVKAIQPNRCIIQNPTFHNIQIHPKHKLRFVYSEICGWPFEVEPLCDELLCLPSNIRTKRDLKFYATGIPNGGPYRFTFIKNNSPWQTFTTTTPRITIDANKFSGSDFKLQIIIESIGNIPCITPDTLTLLGCDNVEPVICNAKEIQISIDTLYFENCNTANYEGTIEVFEDSAIVYKEWQIFEGNSTPIIRSIDNRPKLDDQQYTFQNAGPYRIDLVAGRKSIDEDSIIHVCDTVASRSGIINTIPDIIYKWECDINGYKLIAYASGTYYNPTGATPIHKWWVNNNYIGIMDTVVIDSFQNNTNISLRLQSSVAESNCEREINIISPIMTAGNIGQIDPTCQNNPITFIAYISPSDGPKIKTYLWDFGDNNYSKMESPKHAYNDTGTYNVHLTIINEYGCEFVMEKMVKILPNTLEGYITCIPDTCRSQYLLEFNQTQGNQIQYYLWNTGDFNASIIINNDDNYSVIVTDVKGCMFKAQKEVMINDPLITIEGPDKACPNELTEFTIFINGDYDLKVFSANSLIISPGNNKYFITIPANKDSVIIKVEARKGNVICKTITKVVKINKITNFELIKDSITCDPFRLRIKTNPVFSVIWNDQNGIISSGPSIQTSKKGNYGATLIDSSGCFLHVETPIQGRPRVGINITGEDYICDSIFFDGTTKKINFLITEYLASSWKILLDNVVVDSALGSNPRSLTLTKIMENKEIKLVVMDAFGCRIESKSYKFHILPCSCNASYVSIAASLDHYTDSADFDIYKVIGVIRIPSGFNICPEGLEFLDPVEWIRYPTFVQNGPYIELRNGLVRQPRDSCNGTVQFTVHWCKGEITCSKTQTINYDCCPIEPDICDLRVTQVQCNYPSMGSISIDLEVYLKEAFILNSACRNGIITIEYPLTNVISSPPYYFSLTEYGPSTHNMSFTGTMGQGSFCFYVRVKSTNLACHEECILGPICINPYTCQVINGNQFAIITNNCGSQNVDGTNSWNILTQLNNPDGQYVIESVNANYGTMQDNYYDINGIHSTLIMPSSSTSATIQLLVHDLNQGIVFTTEKPISLDQCLMGHTKKEVNTTPVYSLQTVPNPSSHLTTFYYKLVKNPISPTINIFNMASNQEIVKIPCNDHGFSEFDASNLPSGVYYIILEENGFKRNVQKWVVLR